MKIRTSSKNDEFFTPKYAVKPLLKYLKDNSLIWCPFDKKDSNYVKVLSDAGHSIVYTHIGYEEDQDFLKINKDDWAFYSGCGHTNVRVSEVDYIISNPPFSKKTKVLEHLFYLNKPFSILLPLSALEGINRHKLFRKYGKDIQVIIFDKRISYTGKSPNFNSIYLCWKMNLPKDIIFEKLESKSE